MVRGHRGRNPHPLTRRLASGSPSPFANGEGMTFHGYAEKSLSDEDGFIHKL